MASCVSALSSIVANGHQVLPTFPPPLCSSRTASFPRYGWKPALPLHALPPPSPAAFDAEPVPIPKRDVWLRVHMYRFAAVPTGPWLSTVYYPSPASMSKVEGCTKEFAVSPRRRFWGLAGDKRRKRRLESVPGGQLESCGENGLEKNWTYDVFLLDQCPNGWPLTFSRKTIKVEA